MKKNESGRSMGEMLGVLAIIGVLSVGGIAGYTMAMNRYRANEIIDSANKYAVIAYSAYMTAKMMHNGDNAKGLAAVPVFKDTGLFGSNSKVNGAKIEIAATNGVDETGVKMVLTFTDAGKKTCQAAATSLGILATADSNGSVASCGSTPPTITYKYTQS